MQMYSNDDITGAMACGLIQYNTVNECLTVIIKHTTQHDEDGVFNRAILFEIVSITVYTSKAEFK